jgi:hypothetical protein
MRPYLFRRDFVGTVRGVNLFVDAGATVDLSDEDAYAIRAELPGVFDDPQTGAPGPAPVPKPESESRAVESPPADRMLRRPRQKRGV